MPTDPQKHHRRSIRLPEYDYTHPGGYFVTLVTFQRLPLFGQIRDEAALLSPAGLIAWEEWFKTAELRQNVRLEQAEFVVMPNHIHGIIWITEGEPAQPISTTIDSKEPERAQPTPTSPVEAQRDLSKPVRAQPTSTSPVRAQRRCAPTTSAPTPAPTRLPPKSLGAIVRAYKSAVTYRINAHGGTRGAPVWQRNYYEHIIRNQADLERIRAYIQNNPLRWEQDQLRAR